MMSFLEKKIDGVLLRCLEKDESEKVLNELHSGNAGGHFSGETTAHKVPQRWILLAYIV
jgi:hypothetical protein